jgi:hypothetical protein
MIRLGGLSRGRRVWPLTMLLAGTLATAATLFNAHVGSMLSGAKATFTTLKVAAQSRPASGTTEERQDYVLRLNGQSITPQPFIAHLQADAKQRGVTVATLAVSSKPATPALLGRDELQVSLRGAYASVKQTLGEMMDRHPSAVVQQLSMRRGSTGADVELQVRVLLLQPPAAETGANSQPRS